MVNFAFVKMLIFFLISQPTSDSHQSEEQSEPETQRYTILTCAKFLTCALQYFKPVFKGGGATKFNFE